MTIPLGAAHAFMGYIREHPPPLPGAKNAFQITCLRKRDSETLNNVINDSRRRKNRINDSPLRVLANRVIKGG